VQLQVQGLPEQVPLEQWPLERVPKLPELFESALRLEQEQQQQQQEQEREQVQRQQEQVQRALQERGLVRE
jgi:hypothetical protein